MASQVGCGDTINVDTKLEQDLVNCPDNGIVIGKDGITLDLNGHTVDGNDALIRECPAGHICDVGILDDGHAGVTVSGGRVKQFGTGVLVLTAKHVSLERLAASGNHFNGVLFVGSMQSRLVRSTVARNGLETDFPGIAVVAESRRILIADNISRQNADLGLFLTESDANRVVGNDFSNNPEAGMIVEGDA
ncbi:MAG: right-handed parallel beta-helix repeat-containing protein, partial [Solirubrobacterales bacterium]|nr:right-handed parallel beta-helix repeat-containing protein [Solirubrobacterales bacterium]